MHTQIAQTVPTKVQHCEDGCVAIVDGSARPAPSRLQRYSVLELAACKDTRNRACGQTNILHHYVAAQTPKTSAFTTKYGRGPRESRKLADK